MAGPTKKKCFEQDIADKGDSDSSEFDDDDYIEGDDDGEEVEDMEGQEIQVDFEARSPEDSDFHGIRKLLQQLFLKANINISDLSDTILAQNYVGSVIKQCTVDEEDDMDDDDDMQEVYGVVTVVNITDKKDMEFTKQLQSLLLDRCKQPNVRAQLSDVFNAEGSTGLLINERFINIPPQISLPSFESLWKEVDKAKSKNMPYNFNRFLMISKTYKAPALPHQPPSETPMFTNAEEEFFYQESSLTFNYSVAEEKDTGVSGTWDDEDDQMEPQRTVMVIPVDKLPVIMARLSETLSQ